MSIIHFLNILNDLLNVWLSVANDATASAEEKEKQEDEYFRKVYAEWKGVDAKDTDNTYKVIPKFYFKVLSGVVQIKFKLTFIICLECFVMID